VKIGSCAEFDTEATTGCAKSCNKCTLQAILDGLDEDSPLSVCPNPKANARSCKVKPDMPSNAVELCDPCASLYDDAAAECCGDSEMKRMYCTMGDASVSEFYFTFGADQEQSETCLNKDGVDIRPCSVTANTNMFCGQPTDWTCGAFKDLMVGRFDATGLKDTIMSCTCDSGALEGCPGGDTPSGGDSGVCDDGSAGEDCTCCAAEMEACEDDETCSDDWKNSDVKEGGTPKTEKGKALVACLCSKCAVIGEGPNAMCGGNDNTEGNAATTMEVGLAATILAVFVISKNTY